MAHGRFRDITVIGGGVLAFVLASAIASGAGAPEWASTGAGLVAAGGLVWWA